MSGNNGGKKGKGKQQEKPKEAVKSHKEAEKGENEATNILKLKEELEAFKKLLSPMTEETDDKLMEKIEQTKEFSLKITDLNESVKNTVKAMEDMCDKALLNDFDGYQVNKPAEIAIKPEPKVIEKGSKDEKAILKLQDKIAQTNKSISDVENIANKVPSNSAVARNKDRIVRLLAEEIKEQEHFIELMMSSK